MFLPRSGCLRSLSAISFAAAIGLVWIAGRILFIVAVRKPADSAGRARRSALATVALWLGATGAIIWRLAHG